MDETSHEWNPPSDPAHALEIVNASFGWDSPPDDQPGQQSNGPGGGSAGGGGDAGKAGTKYQPVDGDGDEGKTNAVTGSKEETREGAAVSDSLLGNGATSKTPAVTLKNISLVVQRVSS